MSAATIRPIFAEFRPGRLAVLDGRRRESRLLRDMRAALTAHLGGKPNAAQVVLIERAAQLQLRVALFEQKWQRTGEMPDHDQRSYLAWSNALSRTLANLGLQPAAARQPSVDEILAQIHARTAPPAVTSPGAAP